MRWWEAATLQLALHDESRGATVPRGCGCFYRRAPLATLVLRQLQAEMDYGKKRMVREIVIAHQVRFVKLADFRLFHALLQRLREFDAVIHDGKRGARDALNLTRPQNIHVRGDLDHPLMLGLVHLLGQVVNLRGRVIDMNNVIAPRG